MTVVKPTLEQPLFSSLLKFKVTPKKPEEARVRRLALGIFKAMEAAIESFQNGRYSDFDALVGENACQIRAVKIQQLSRTVDFNEKLSEIQNLIGRLEENALQPHLKMDADAFLKERQLLPMASDDLRFLTTSFLLCKTRMSERLTEDRSDYRERLDPERLEPIIGKLGSKNLSNRVLTQARLSLATDSVRYLQGLAAESGSADLIALSGEKAVKVDAFKRQTLPCLVSMQLLLPKLLRENQGILLKVVRFQGAAHKRQDLEEQGTLPFYLKPNADRSDFILSDEAPPPGACVVIEGKQFVPDGPLPSAEDLKQTLSALSPVKLLLANAAAHPAYPSSLREEPIPFDLLSVDARQKYEAEVSALEQLAVDEGCCFDDPRLFLIFHIFCDQIGGAV